MAKRLLLWLIRIYREGISPFIRPTCRFTPSCSRYAYDAIERFGAVKGGVLAIKRLLKCHPFYPGGYDPVPEKDGQ